MKDIIDLLATSSTYPMISPRGKVFFKSTKKVVLDADKAREIIERLKIRTAGDCEKIRAEVRKRAAELRENRPIREWIEEERPREMLVKYGPETLSLSKLMAIILRIGREGISAEELSKRLLNKFGTLREIDSSPNLLVKSEMSQK